MLVFPSNSCRIDGITGCKSAAAAKRSVCAAANGANKRKRKSLYTKHHDLSRFNQGGDRFSDFKLHLSSCFRGDDGIDDLAADRELDLSEEAINLDFNNASHELIASAQGAHHLAFRSFRLLGLMQQAV